MSSRSNDIQTLFRALADRTRIRLLNLMRDDEVCVCFFVEILKISQPKISRHLAYLRRAGLVSARREGKWMHYRIATPTDKRAAEVLTQAMSWMAEDRELQRDRIAFEKVCCAPSPPVRLRRAPTPRPSVTGNKEVEDRM